MDHFLLTPREILEHISSYIQSLENCLGLLRVCKRFKDILDKNEKLWRSLCLSFWKSRDMNMDLEWIQKHSRKEWIWLTRSFVMGFYQGISDDEGNVNSNAL
jgi:hypothetical protein